MFIRFLVSINYALKKKPLQTIANAHGGTLSHPNWITSIAAVANSGLFASGSQDGQIRLWKTSADYRRIEPLFSIPIVGFVNSLEFSRGGDYLVAGVGQEHRLGRWWRIKEGRNQLAIIPLKKKKKQQAPSETAAAMSADSITG